MTWNPTQYGKFAEPRLRPGLDLISRLPDRIAGPVVDLGCGTGVLTQRLADRYGAVTGVDRSLAMLAHARDRFPALDWVEETIEEWMARPADPPFGLVFANASLHWVEGHQHLFPALIGMLASGGVLAVQMPRSMSLPSHRALADLAAEPPYRDRVAVRADWVWEPTRYLDLLASRVQTVEMWETEYLHLLEGEDAVFEWVKGTTLTPIRDALPPGDFDRFAAAYRIRLRDLYPRRDDGKTVYPFRRLFILAVR